jgi:hypothetical protein
MDGGKFLRLSRLSDREPQVLIVHADLSQNIRLTRTCVILVAGVTAKVPLGGFS